jgi:hypothetical protein
MDLHPVGNAPLDPEVKALIVRLARQNPRFGYGKLVGELRKLGYRVGRSTVRDVLKRNGIPPAPQRGRVGSNWRTFLSHYKGQMLACDFFRNRLIKRAEKTPDGYTESWQTNQMSQQE